MLPYKKILLSLGCKEGEKRVIQEAIRMASNSGAELSVIHVNHPGAGKAHMMMDSLPLKTADDIRTQFRSLGYEKTVDTIRVMIIEGANYPKEIAKASKDVDLLIVGHYPRSRLLATLIDSVDERLSDLVSCPMLLVPCDK